MPALFVECHSCRREFPTGVTLNEKGIRGYLNDGVVLRCPYCGIEDPYFTSEHRLPRVPEAEPPNPLLTRIAPLTSHSLASVV